MVDVPKKVFDLLGAVIGGEEHQRGHPGQGRGIRTLRLAAPYIFDPHRRDDALATLVA